MLHFVEALAACHRAVRKHCACHAVVRVRAAHTAVEIEPAEGTLAPAEHHFTVAGAFRAVHVQRPVAHVRLAV